MEFLTGFGERELPSGSKKALTVLLYHSPMAMYLFLLGASISTE